LHAGGNGNIGLVHVGLWSGFYIVKNNFAE
jgi:hypothetical protein